MTITYDDKALPLTAVTRNGEKCGKFTFIFRKKFYLSRKYAVPKFATSCSRETLAKILFFPLAEKNCVCIDSFRFACYFKYFC